MFFLPRIDGEYDLGISFLTPHDPLLEKAVARSKIGWIHTDYASLETSVDVEFEAHFWRRLDKLIAVSDDTATNFIRRFPDVHVNVTVIENILSSSFVRRQADLTEGLTDLPAKDGAFIICSVGRLTFQKGFDEAIKACASLVASGSVIRWYVIGQGPDHEALTRLIAKYGLQLTFILMGAKANPYPYMAKCDLYVQPSRYEGKAVAVREAQMLGLPVLITNFPTSASQLEEGVDGCVCPMGAVGIADGIKKMMNTPELMSKISEVAKVRDYSNEDEVSKVLGLVPN
jgi:glycosyltransferase involved in cell wall biosynthesis